MLASSLFSSCRAYLHAPLTHPKWPSEWSKPHKASETLLRFELRCSRTSGEKDTRSCAEVEKEIIVWPEAISVERTERFAPCALQFPPRKRNVCCRVQMNLEEGTWKERPDAEENFFTLVFHSALMT